MTDTGVAWRIRRFSTATSFLDRAKPWLLEAEAEHNLILGIAEQLESGNHSYEDPIFLATVEGPEVIAGCAFRTPPFKLGLTRVPEEAVPLLVDEASTLYSSLPAVMGPPSAARRFAEGWSAKHGVDFEVGMRMRIFALDRVVPPAKLAPGRLRPASTHDRELAIEWTQAFASDTGVWGGDPGLLARRLIEEGRLFL